jgi:hypothetical protein
MSINTWEGEQGGHKSLPSADAIANSMFGGSEEIFKQPPPPPLTDATQVPISPPLPINGLPEGWTLEQWSHYGQEWLDNENLE